MTGWRAENRLTGPYFLLLLVATFIYLFVLFLSISSLSRSQDVLLPPFGHGAADHRKELPSSSLLTQMTTLDQRDVALVGWYRTNPPPIIKALTPPDLNWSNDIIEEEGGTFVLTSRINIPQHLQFFANVVLGFGQFRIPTQEEEDRFALLQREYHGVNNSSDEDADAPPVMRLSPRMIIDPTEAKSERRNVLKEAVEDFLDTLAKEAEGDLLGEVDAETKRLRSKKERDRRRRKAKKKKNKKKGKIDGGGELVESELRTKTSEGQTMDGQGDESLASEDDQVDTHEDNVLPAASSSETIDTAEPSDENASRNNEEEEESATDDDDNDETKPVVKAETKMNKMDEPVTAAKSKSKPKVSYLAMAAKVPKSTKKKGAAKNTSSLPPPSTRISALDIPPVQVSATTTDTVCPIPEQEKIDRLEEQLSAQRRNHLELIQQVQLRAFIAETKATAALDRSRELERQILDATYPEVEATTAEAAAANATGGGVPLSPRNGSNGRKTKEDLEHELRRQRRENLAMMQRVQLRTYLAETKAKAAEDRSMQLEELLKDAKEGKSMT